MKGITKGFAFACLLLFTVPVLVLTGCGRGNNMNGTYTFHSTIIGGQTLKTFSAIKAAMLDHLDNSDKRSVAIFELSNSISLETIDKMDEVVGFLQLKEELEENLPSFIIMVRSVVIGVETAEIDDDWEEFAVELSKRIATDFCDDEFDYNPEALTQLIKDVVLGLFPEGSVTDALEEFIEQVDLENPFVTVVEAYVNEIMGESWIIAGTQLTRKWTTAKEDMTSRFVYENNKFVVEDFDIEATFSSGTISITMGEMIVNLRK